MKTKSIKLVPVFLTLALISMLGMVCLVGCSEAPDDAQLTQTEQVEDENGIEDTTNATDEAAVEAAVEDAIAGTFAGDTSTSNTNATKSGNGTNSTSGGAGNTSTPATKSTPSAPSASAPAAPSHTHNYSIPITETKTVTDQAAWTEKVYGMRCSCGQVFTDKASGTAHNQQNHDHWSSSCVVNTIQHPAVTHQETVTVGYKCSCGATK